MVLPQSKLTLSKQLTKRRGNSNTNLNGVRIMTFAILLVAIFSLCINLQMIRLPISSTTSASTSTSSTITKSLELFSPPPPPFSTSQQQQQQQQQQQRKMITSRNEIEAWNKWAESPTVGSYLLFDNNNNESNNNKGSGTVIHFPHMDLQTYYHDQKPSFGTMTSFLLHNIPFPEPDCAVLTRKGNKFMSSGVKYNQDRIVILSFPNNNDNNSNTNTNDWWMGLFDGHGFFGHATSHYLSLEFPKKLVEIAEQINAKQTSSSTVTTADVEIAIQGIFHHVQQSLPLLPEGGSTGISIWKRQDYLYISNVGDSTAFVASYDKYTGIVQEIIYQTKPHKPDLPEERARIEAVGGEVLDAPYPGASARLLIPDPINPMNSMALAMSRSLGDFEGAKYGLSSEPTTYVMDLKRTLLNNNNNNNNNNGQKDQLNYMVVAASDGLLDKVSIQKVAQVFANSLLQNGNDNNSNSNNNPEQQQQQQQQQQQRILPLEAAEQLIMESSEGWKSEMDGGGDYRDDISVAVHRLQL